MARLLGQLFCIAALTTLVGASAVAAAPAGSAAMPMPAMSGKAPFVEVRGRHGVHENYDDDDDGYYVDRRTGAEDDDDYDEPEDYGSIRRPYGNVYPGPNGYPGPQAYPGPYGYPGTSGYPGAYGYRYAPPPPAPYDRRLEYRAEPVPQPLPPPAYYEPPRPSSCGQYRYWNGDYCADARRERPYVGPRW